MKVIYAQAALYAYPGLNHIISEIEKSIMRIALNSRTDYSPATTQCERIVSKCFEKDMLLELKARIEKALSCFNQDDLDRFDYKYFKQKPKEYFKDFDTSSRQYFRIQNKIAKKFAAQLEKAGADDTWFETEGKSFMLGYIQFAVEHENNYVLRTNQQGGVTKKN